MVLIETAAISDRGVKEACPDSVTNGWVDQANPMIPGSEETFPSPTSPEKGWLTPVCVSAAAHAALCVLLSWILVTGDAKWTASDVIDSSFETPRPVEPVDSVSVAMPPSQASAQPDLKIAAASAHAGLFAETRIASPTLYSPPRFSPPHIIYCFPWTEEVGPLDPVAGDGSLPGSGSGTGDGAGGFFGVRPEGKLVVFVVDGSRSMNQPYPGELKTRFRRLKRELVNAIGGLSADQSFYVVFFNIDAIPMPSSHPVAATPENKQRIAQWVATMKADRETDPRRALSIALRMRPDVLYFLTDGSFDRPIEREILRVAQKQTTIHTFAFGDDAGRDTLRSLAKANGGKFLVIP